MKWPQNRGDLSDSVPSVGCCVTSSDADRPWAVRRQEDGRWCLSMWGKKLLSFCLNYSARLHGNKLTPAREKEDPALLSWLLESSRGKNFFSTKHVLRRCTLPHSSCSRTMFRENSFQSKRTPSKHEMQASVWVDPPSARTLFPCMARQVRYGEHCCLVTLWDRRCLHKQIVSPAKCWHMAEYCGVTPLLSITKQSSVKFPKQNICHQSNTPAMAWEGRTPCHE